MSFSWNRNRYSLRIVALVKLLTSKIIYQFSNQCWWHYLTLCIVLFVRLSHLTSDIITIGGTPVDEVVIDETLTFITNKLEEMKSDIERHQLTTNENCERHEMKIHNNKTLEWRRYVFLRRVCIYSDTKE